MPPGLRQYIPVSVSLDIAGMALDVLVKNSGVGFGYRFKRAVYNQYNPRKEFGWIGSNTRN